MNFTDSQIYLKAGKQTQITPVISKFVRTVRGDSLAKIKSIISLVSSLKYTGFDINFFRKRTAEQIIQDGFTTGCTDSCLVYVALAKACQIPTRYVETIDKEWLETGNRDSIRGHQYALSWVLEEKRWIWVDPLGARLDTPNPDKEGRVIYKFGKDSWDIGIDNFETLKKKFIDYKTSYNRKP